MKFCIFDCSSAKVGAAHCRTFFARTKKDAKKVRGGCAHPLDSRGRRKTSSPLRSACFTAILEIPQYVETQNTQFFFTSQRLRANTSVFFKIFGFWLYWDFVLYLSFRAGIHGTKTGLFSRKIKLVIFSRLFAKVEAAHSRPKKYAEGVRTLSTPGGRRQIFKI